MARPLRAPAVRSLPSRLEVTGEPQTYGQARSLLAVRTRTGTRGGLATYRVGVRFGRVDAVFEGVSVTTIDRDVAVVDGPVIAANRQGDAVLAWSSSDADRDHGRLWISERRRGGDFRSPRVIVGTGLATHLSVAVGERGDLVVAYAHRRGRTERVQARVRRRGHALGPVEDLGVNRGLAFPDATMTPTGRAIVAWQTFDTGEEVNEPTRVYAAVKPAGPRHFRRAQLLDPGDSPNGVLGRVAVDAAHDGTATVGWNGRVGGGASTTFPVRTAATNARAVFGDAQTLAGAAGHLRDVAVADDGTTAVAWSRTGAAEFAGAGLTAALRPAGSRTFGVAELVSADPFEHTGPATLAFPVGRHEPVAAWLVRDAAGHTSVRVARRG